ncbi:hypothetical protein NL676_032744 [Syzygium grande]|nr:hypothetical protein NL676_032744 [Syzygium grande]
MDRHEAVLTLVIEELVSPRMEKEEEIGPSEAIMLSFGPKDQVEVERHPARPIPGRFPELHAFPSSSDPLVLKSQHRRSPSSDWSLFSSRLHLLSLTDLGACRCLLTSFRPR